jgi:hypothetical protein
VPILGALVLGWGLWREPERAWAALLADFSLFAGIAQAGAVFAAALVVTRAEWAGPLLRISLSLARFLPVALGLFLLLPFGFHTLYPAPASRWMGLAAVCARDGVVLFALAGLSFAFARALHHDRAPTQVLAVALLIGYAFGWSLLAFDLLMALEPQWISTLFGAFLFVGNLYGALAAIGLLALWRSRRPYAVKIATPDRLHDLGKLLFAFCLLWTYLMFSQLLPIWYANLPHETAYLVERAFEPPWAGLAWTVLGLCFALPFALLLGRGPKRDPRTLGAACFSVLAGLWLQHGLLVAPAVSGRLPLGWVELGAAAAFAGAMILTITVRR